MPTKDRILNTILYAAATAISLFAAAKDTIAKLYRRVNSETCGLLIAYVMLLLLTLLAMNTRWY